MSVQAPTAWNSPHATSPAMIQAMMRSAPGGGVDAGAVIFAGSIRAGKRPLRGGRSQGRAAGRPGLVRDLQRLERPLELADRKSVV